MASTSEAGMKVEAAAEESGLGRGRAVAAVDQLYGLKKQRRERPLGCTTAKERISKMPPCVAGKRSSIYRGVTRHRWTGRYEAHLWDKSTWNQNQNKKGKQVYLGAYDDEEAAARAYDLAALKYWGAGTLINFPVSDYARDLEEMQMISKEEYLVSLRRKSSAFSRGLPKCRGVSRHLQSGRLEASLGHMLGSDYCNSLSTASDPSMEKKYGNNICMDRKIDLTSHIRWWVPKGTHQPDSISKALDEKHGESEDINRELRAFECQRQPTVPYQLPSLGVPHDTKAQASAVSACTILSRSAAFKNFLQKLSESHDGVCNTKETGYEKAVPMLSTGGIQRAGVSSNFSDLPLQRTQYPSGGILTVPSKTNCNPVDPVPDALFWTSLVPPAGLSVTSTLRKTETSSPYTYNCQD